MNFFCVFLSGNFKYLRKNNVEEDGSVKRYGVPFLVDSSKGPRRIVDADATDQVVIPNIKSSEITMQHPPFASGSFGQLYKGRCRGHEVAIKVLDGIAWDEKVLAEFVAEVTIMARLLHPNILLCMGACTETTDLGEHKYVMVIDYMPRGDLHKLLHNKDSKLSLTRKLQFAIEISEAMAWLHGQGILHRDLKPANVLLDNNWTCKICDFGLSQITKSKQKKKIKMRLLALFCGWLQKFC